MSTDLRTQLAAYGDLFVADLDAVTVEDAMTTRTGEGKVKALEPVQRFGDGKRNRRGVLLAAAVFIVVVAAGLALAFALRGTTEDVVEVPAPPFETPEAALAAFGAAIEAGDYEGFRALFADGVEDFYGNEAVTEQRKRERFATQSLWPPVDTSVSVSCAANPVVDRSWTCTQAFPDGAAHRVVAAAGVLSGPVVLGEMDISLAEDGLISRVSNVRYADTSGAHSLAMFEFNEWVASAHPDLAASLEVLYMRGDHESFPLPMSPQEISREYSAAVDEYVEFLEGGGAAGAIPVPPFATPEEAIIASDALIRSGDYEAWTSLFVDNSSDYFGGDGSTDQRRRERFEWWSLASTADPPPSEDARCVANEVVERSWTCTLGHPHEDMTKILDAAGVLSEPVVLMEQNISLSADGLIQRLSVMQLSDRSGDQNAAMADFGEWLASANPDLAAAEAVLWGRSSHETDPLPMPVQEMVERAWSAADDYVEFLGTQ